MFKESLPESCPPSTATALNGTFLRLVETTTVSPNSFLSRTALGLTPLPGKECSCSACSLIVPSVTREALADLTKYPKLKKMTSVAILTVSPNDGVGEIGGKHIDYWMYSTFDPVKNVSHVTEIVNYGQ